MTKGPAVATLGVGVDGYTAPKTTYRGEKDKVTDAKGFDSSGPRDSNDQQGMCLGLVSFRTESPVGDQAEGALGQGHLDGGSHAYTGFGTAANMHLDRIENELAQQVLDQMVDTSKPRVQGAMERDSKYSCKVQAEVVWSVRREPLA